MLRLAADENFNGKIIRGLRREKPDLDIVTAQEAGLAKQNDPAILAWAAKERRLLLTHDVATMSKYAYDRMAARELMSGVLQVAQDLPIGRVIEDILTIIGASSQDEWEGKVEYLPL